MHHDHDFTNSHLSRQTAFRSRIHSGQAIAIAVSVSQEDQPLITNFEVAALMMLGLVAIGLPSIFEALIR